MSRNKKNHYKKWSKNDLIQEIMKLEKRKKYGIIWDELKTKEVFEEEVEEKIPMLIEVKDKKVITDLKKPTNILIEGDNYHALSVLQYTHSKKIDLIYIDPPYNTGKGFTYNDKRVDAEDSYKHSKWLSFMAKRLKLTKKLLSKSGIIFISIDDNEQAQLKILCDEIFGWRNFVEMLVIESNSRGSQASKHFANVHEYILVYANSSDDLQIDGFIKDESTVLKEYTKIDKNGKRFRLLGLRQRGGEWKREQRKNMFFPIYVNTKDNSVSLTHTIKHTKKVLPKRPSGEEGRWTWARSKVESNINLLQGNKVKRKGQKDFYDIFRISKYEDDHGNETLTKPKTIWNDKEINYQNGRTALKEFFDGEDVFDFPKPVYLIKKIISMFNKRNLTILDFFVGTGTTAEAILRINHELNKNHKFIICTNNETNICTEICYPRIKKSITGYENSSGGKINGLGGNLRYFKTNFVKYESTDQNKKTLVTQSTEMLTLKENCFELIKDGNKFKIFKNHHERYLGIIYDNTGIESFKKEILKLCKTINTYVFSFDDIVDVDEFTDVMQWVKLKPIPSSILNIYRSIFTYVQTEKISRKGS